MPNLRDQITEMVEQPFKNKEGKSTTLQAELQDGAGLNATQAQEAINQFVASTTRQLENNPALASNPKTLASNVVEDLAANETLKDNLVAGVRSKNVAARFAFESTVVNGIKKELGAKMETFFENKQPTLSAAAQENQQTRQARSGFTDPDLPTGLPKTIGQMASKASGL